MSKDSWDLDSLPEEDKKRYLAKLESVGLEKCPYSVPDEAWTTEIGPWPEILIFDLYNYFFKYPDLFALEGGQRHMQKDSPSYKLFIVGSVHAVEHFQTATSNFVFRAVVLPHDEINCHKPWIVTNKDGVILGSHCSCITGSEESCCHAGAVLFKIEALIRLGYVGDYREKMDRLLSDCVPEDDIKPMRICDMDWSGELKGRRKNKGKKARHRQQPAVKPPTEEEKLNFLRALAKTGANSVILQYYPEIVAEYGPKEKEPKTAAAGTSEES